jgi:hypothetical protein
MQYYPLVLHQLILIDMQVNITILLVIIIIQDEYIHHGKLMQIHLDINMVKVIQ